jgi:hypothetical protein
VFVRQQEWSSFKWVAIAHILIVGVRQDVINATGLPPPSLDLEIERHTNMKVIEKIMHEQYKVLDRKEAN